MAGRDQNKLSTRRTVGRQTSEWYSSERWQAPLCMVGAAFSGTCNGEYHVMASAGTETWNQHTVHGRQMTPSHEPQTTAGRPHLTTYRHVDVNINNKTKSYTARCHKTSNALHVSEWCKQFKCLQSDFGLKPSFKASKQNSHDLSAFQSICHSQCLFRAHSFGRCRCKVNFGVNQRKFIQRMKIKPLMCCIH